MKAKLFIIALMLLSVMSYGQRNLNPESSDNNCIYYTEKHIADDGLYKITICVGDIYRIDISDGNPFTGVKYRYLRVIDFKGDWVKYTWETSINKSKSKDAYIVTEKVRTFFGSLKYNEYVKL